LWSVHSLFERLPRLIDALLLVVLSLFLLTLYVTQKGHIEYLWLALYEALQAPIAFVELAALPAAGHHLVWRGDAPVTRSLRLPVLRVSSGLPFTPQTLVRKNSSLHRHHSRWSLPGVPVRSAVKEHAHLADRGVVGSVIWLGGWLVFVLITLISATVKRNFEAGLLLIPLALTAVGLAELLLTGD